MDTDEPIQRWHVFIYSKMNPKGGMNDYKGQITTLSAFITPDNTLEHYLGGMIDIRGWNCNDGWGEIYTINCSDEFTKRATFQCNGKWENETIKYYAEDFQWITEKL